MMCGAIPVPCEICGKYFRITKLCDCDGEKSEFDLS